MEPVSMRIQRDAESVAWLQQNIDKLEREREWWLPTPRAELWGLRRQIEFASLLVALRRHPVFVKWPSLRVTAATTSNERVASPCNRQKITHTLESHKASVCRSSRDWPSLLLILHFWAPTGFFDSSCYIFHHCWYHHSPEMLIGLLKLILSFLRCHIENQLLDFTLRYPSATNLNHYLLLGKSAAYQHKIWILWVNNFGDNDIGFITILKYPIRCILTWLSTTC